jgi:hypothetical protein
MLRSIRLHRVRVRGDLEIKDYVVLQKPHDQTDQLPPPRTLIMDVTMTHPHYGLSGMSGLSAFLRKTIFKLILCFHAGDKTHKAGYHANLRCVCGAKQVGPILQHKSYKLLKKMLLMRPQNVLMMRELPRSTQIKCSCCIAG